MADHPGRNNQIVRQWSILMRLAANSRSGIGVSVKELQDEYEVTRRTIERDIEGLTEAGFPILLLRQEGQLKFWGLTQPAPNLPPFPLDQDELIAVYLAAGLLEFFEGTPYQEGMDRVRTKIAATLPPRVLARLDDIRDHFLPMRRQRATYAAGREIVAALNRALLTQHQCRIVYHAPSRAAAREHVVRPCGILVHRQILYLAALVGDRTDPTIFAVARIRSIEVLDEQFTMPDDWSLARYVDPHFGIWKGEPAKVALRFAPHAAHIPEEIEFHSTQKISKNDDGSVDVEMTVGGLNEVVWWVLSYADAVCVLRPKELANRVRDTARAIAALYEAETPSRKPARSRS
ncbi:MAG: WYL domain-containing protein [Deltaproteobacteria bacterium]|nr:WYL domain-containing protein [Deltaproteobacteria bacterium]